MTYSIRLISMPVAAVMAGGRLDAWANVAGIITNASVIDLTEDDLERAVEFAEAGSWEPVEDLARDLTTPAAAPGVPS